MNEESFSATPNVLKPLRDYNKSILMQTKVDVRKSGLNDYEITSPDFIKEDLFNIS